jgi:general secretion pathway protein I
MPRDRPSGELAGERGFSLLEVLIAFTIAALALGMLFKAAGGGLASVHIAGRYEEAVSRAKSHLAAIGRDADVVTGDQQGDDGGGYHWHVTIDPVGVTRPPPTDPQHQQDPVILTLYAVTVGIAWRDGAVQREVRLHSQRLGKPKTTGNG